MHFTVIDRTGAVIPGATISVANQTSGAVTATKTGPDGSADLVVLPGNYHISIVAIGFTQWISKTDLTQNQTKPIDVKLDIDNFGYCTLCVTPTPEIPFPKPEIHDLIPAVAPPEPTIHLASFKPHRQHWFAAVSVPAPVEAAAAPDMILYHGAILTGQGLAEGKPVLVQAIAVLNGTIEAVGSDAAIKPLAGPTTTMRDLHGAFLMPGLNDAHVHLGGAGRTKLNVDLTGVKSLDEMLAQVQAYAAKSTPGHWLTGGNWDHTLWAEKTLPTRQMLDRITGNHPAMLERIDGHIAIANSLALKAAGITGKTAPPQGGAIDLDASGEPTGILRESAMELVDKIVPPPTPDERRQGLQLAIDDALAHGLTSVQDNSEWEDFLTYEELEKEGKLKLRISEWLPFSAPVELLKEHRAHHDQADPMLHTGMLKGFMDGSLGSRTAAMKAPFSDDPTNMGLAQYKQDQLNAMAIERAKAGFQIGFHAIGDRAAAMALDAFSQTYDACPEGTPQTPENKAQQKDQSCQHTVAQGHRDRIEHAQVVDPADIPRFARLGVIASMQPNHLLTDMNWAEDRLGPQRAAYSYAWKAFLEAGVVVAFGTDYPVEPVTPFRGLYAAVTRANEAGTKTYFPENKLTRTQALYAYTQGSAYAEFAEMRKGQLLPGFEADYVLLDRNLLTCPAPEILKTQVIETVVGGKTVYKAQQ
jgi:predicted amidohydrolase YtcJ